MVCNEGVWGKRLLSVIFVCKRLYTHVGESVAGIYKLCDILKNMTFEKDNIFIDKIDCSFPFQDAKLCFDLIDEASLLSQHSMFKVIEEICRIRDDERESVSIEFLRELLETINSKFKHMYEL